MFHRLRSVLRNEAAEGDSGGEAAEPAEQAKDEQPPKPKGKTVGELKAEAFADKKREAPRGVEGFLAEQRAKKAGDKAPTPAKAEPADKPAPKAAAREPAEADDDEPSEKAQKTAKAIEREGGDAPDQKANETDKQYELRLAKALQDIRTQEGMTKREKARAETAERNAAEVTKKVEQYEKLLARGKSPEEALEFILDTTGLTLEAIVRGLNDGKIKPPRQRAKVDPEVQAKIDKQEAEIARLAKLAEDREVKEKEELQGRQFQQHVGQAQKWLSENLSDYPLLAKLPWAARHIVQEAYKNGGDMGEPARKLQESVVGDFAPLLDDDDALKLLASKASKTAKERVAKAFGLSTAAATAKVVVPEHTRQKPVSKLPTEGPTPEKIDRKTMSMAERKRAATSLLEQRLREQQSKRA